MRLGWTEDGWDDYLSWQTEDRKTLRKINSLIKDAMRDPFQGIGHPEPLKGDLAGLWSRKINDKDRLVYEPLNGEIVVHQCRYHYDDH